MVENFYQLVNQVKHLEKVIKDFDAEENVKAFCESSLYSDSISLTKLKERFLSWYANEQASLDEVTAMQTRTRLLNLKKNAPKIAC